jgi:membrane-associated phospholipid phosphatase
MGTKKIFLLWLVMAAAVLLAVSICIAKLDLPVAQVFAHGVHRMAILGRIFATSVMVSGLSAVVIVLGIIRITRGRLADPLKSLDIASATALFAFIVNDFVFKPAFGRSNITNFLTHQDQGAFHFFAGSNESSFPSGHAVIAAAFLTVLTRLHSRLRAPAAFLMLACASLLVAGDWHFLSDVIAGAFVGTTAGLFASELWLQHQNRRTATAMSLQDAEKRS